AARYRRGTIGVGSWRALLVLAPGGMRPVNSPARNTRSPTSATARTLPARSEPASPGLSDGLVPQVGLGSEGNDWAPVVPAVTAGAGRAQAASPASAARTAQRQPALNCSWAVLRVCRQRARRRPVARRRAGPPPPPW